MINNIKTLKTIKFSKDFKYCISTFHKAFLSKTSSEFQVAVQGLAGNILFTTLSGSSKGSIISSSKSSSFSKKMCQFVIIICPSQVIFFQISSFLTIEDETNEKI